MNEPTQQRPPLGHVTGWKSEPWYAPDHDPKGVYVGNECIAYAHSAPEAARLASAHNDAMTRAITFTLTALEARG